MLTFPKVVQLLQRPHVITAAAALEYLPRLQAMDPRLHERRGASLPFIKRLAAIASKRPAAMEDDEAVGPPPITKPKAYAPMWLGEPDADLEYGWTLKSGVALLSIDTPLVENGFGFCGAWFHGYDSIQAAIQEADADDRVKAMFIRWDSPGGVVAPGIYDLTAFLQARAEDAKPIWSYCDMACSGAYWLAAQTDNLIAPGVGIVGSIGAVWTHTSYAGMDAAHGVKVTAVQFGKHKTDAADWKDLDADAQANIQAMIDDLGEDFLAAVEAGRGSKLTAEKARQTEARVFSAQHRDPEHSGLKHGFVDSIMPQHEAFAALLAEIGAASPLNQRPGSSPAAHAARAASPQMETDMKLRAAITAALARPEAKTAEEKLDAIQQILDEAGDETDPEDKPDDEPPAAGAEEDDKPEADSHFARAMAILDLPEAKGREAQAKKLAGNKAITVAAAKEILAAGPKVSALADKMKDPALSADGGKDKRSEAKRLADEAIANAGIRAAS